MTEPYRPRDPNAPRPKAPKPAAPAGRKNRWGCGIIVAPLAVLAFWGLLNTKHWHPSDEAWPVQGIDVSHHQAEIEWGALEAQGVDFAYIKATEGGISSIRGSRKTGAGGRGRHPPRAYHFFTLCRSGTEQAANFIANVPADAGALPPVVDLEYMGNCSERPKIADFAKELKAYLGAVEAHYGQPATLYLTEEFDTAYAVSSTFDRELWLRSLGVEPDYGARDWTIWEVSNFRQLDGIHGRVDWNVMRAPAE